MMSKKLTALFQRAQEMMIRSAVMQCAGHDLSLA